MGGTGNFQPLAAGGSTVERVKLSNPVLNAPVPPPEGYAAPVTRTPYAAPAYQPAVYQPQPAVQPMARPAAAASYATAAAPMSQYAPQPELAPVQQPQSYQAQAYAPAQVQQQPVQPQSYQAIVDQAEASARGQRYQGAFIPPQPMESGRDRNESWAAPTTNAYVQQTEVQQAPITTPVEKKKGSSLFERITSGIRREIAAARDYDEGLQEQVEEQYEAPKAEMRAAPRRAPDMPAQGRLNIDAPSGPPSGDPELEIPAFLRRQAN